MPTPFGTYHDVTKCEIVGEYTLCLTFDDGTEQVIDFAPMLHGPVFEPLQDLEIFNQVQLNEDTGTVEWPSGADFSPVVLHDWPEYRDKIIEERRKRNIVSA